MRLNSFTASTLPEAMRRVRDTLGADAVILSQQPSEDGTGVRVTAALEDQPHEDFDLASDTRAVGTLDEVSEALAFHRIPAGLCSRLLTRAAGLVAFDPLMALAGALDSEFSFTGLPEARPDRPLMLVGPPGAGKTVTAAKLCARARLAGKAVALVTMDAVKSGGLAQAAAFAEALGIRLVQAADSAALGTALAEVPADHGAIIDTVGGNALDAENMAQLAAAIAAARAEAALVLPSGGDAAECAETAIAYADCGARRLVVTRLDLTRRLAGPLSAAQAASLPLSAASASPEIAAGLTAVNPVALARLLLPGGMLADAAAPTERQAYG